MDLKILEHDQLNELIQVLLLDEYSVIGPTEINGVISYDPISSVNDLPEGIIDHQRPGSYAIQKLQNSRYFGYTVSPYSWKKYLYPPIQSIFKASKNGKDLNIETDNPETKYAFFGVKGCELNAIKIQDQIFLEGQYVDPNYERRRENALIVAVECYNAGETCFCDSVGAGPEIPDGADIVITELIEKGKHYFLIRSETENGQDILNQLRLADANLSHQLIKDAQLENVRNHMKRQVQVSGLKSNLLAYPNHPRWEEVADRCLACSNCTMVCPTCFCMTVEDINDLDGNTERKQRWDSCFTSEFTYMHGGNTRDSVKSRYRNWLTHKFATWQDQFNTLGCIGCGRCITWCPPGIDITEELKALTESPDQYEEKG